MKTKIFNLKVPLDGTCEPYKSLKKAQKAMEMAMDYYIYNMYLEKENLVKEVHEYHGDIKKGNATVVHFDIEEKKVDNLEQWIV